MKRVFVAVAVAASILAFNVEAQQNLGSVKNTGAFRMPQYQNSGAMKRHPKAGQRQSKYRTSGQYRAEYRPPTRQTGTRIRRSSGGSGGSHSRIKYAT